MRVRLKRIGVGLLVAAVLVYLAIGAFFFAVQRSMLFPAPPPREVAATSGQLLELQGPTARVFALWFPPPDASARVVVHLHGNGEQLADQTWLAQRWTAEHFGFLAVELPGYGPAHDQRPSERAAYDAAETALRHLEGPLGISRERIVLEGQSLGTGVATELAARGHGSRLILVSPYSSIADVGAGMLPFLPVSLLVRDRFDSSSKAPRIELPVLVVHGRRDEVIPFRLGEKLAGAFPHARLLALEQAGHNDVFDAPETFPALVGFARER